MIKFYTNENNLTVPASEVYINHNNQTLLLPSASSGPALVPWATGTDGEIAAMINGYYDGTLSLEGIKSVWSVGDVRTMPIRSHDALRVQDNGTWSTNVTVPAQTTAKWAIIDFDHDTLSESINGKTKALITIQMLGTISKEANGSTPYYMSMNNNNKNVYSWRGCILRNYFTGYASASSLDSLDSNGTGALYNALSFKTLVKKVDKVTGTGNGSSYETSIETTKDYVWLPSEWEVQGAKSYSQEGSNGGTQYEYFKTVANKIKYRGWEGTGSAHYWWMRSPHSGSTTAFCFMHTDGRDYAGNAGLPYGAVPACCL